MDLQLCTSQKRSWIGKTAGVLTDRLSRNRNTVAGQRPIRTALSLLPPAREIPDQNRFQVKLAPTPSTSHRAVTQGPNGMHHGLQLGRLCKRITSSHRRDPTDAIPPAEAHSRSTGAQPQWILGPDQRHAPGQDRSCSHSPNLPPAGREPGDQQSQASFKTEDQDSSADATKRHPHSGNLSSLERRDSSAVRGSDVRAMRAQCLLTSRRQLTHAPNKRGDPYLCTQDHLDGSDSRQRKNQGKAIPKQRNNEAIQHSDHKTLS